MENKYKLEIYPLAQKDMEQVFAYIAHKLGNPKSAEKQINDFEEALQHICKYPESCPLINNIYVKDQNVRKLIVNKYIVFYRVFDGRVQVIRVLHKLQNYVALL